MAADQVLFSASKRKVKRARWHISSLERLLTDYLATDWEIKSSDQQILEGGPEFYSEIIGDAIHNLRVSLDLLAVELVSLSGGDTKDVCFPFCKNKDYLEKMIKSRNLYRAKKSYQDILRELKPYKEGNVDLRAIHDLDLQDKHRSLIPATVRMSATICILPSSTPDNIMTKVDTGPPHSITFCFPETSALRGKPVLQTLHRLVETISTIINRFEAVS